MSVRLVYSPAAVRDLERVWDEVFAASADAETADGYLEALREAIRAKTEFPRSGRPVEYCGLFTGFYLVRCKAYSAFYRVREDRMEAARVLFFRQDYMAVLFGGADPGDSGDSSEDRKDGRFL